MVLRLWVSAVAAFFALAALPSVAQADRDPGRFYVRAALGYDWSRDETLRDRSCNPRGQTPYFGCTAGEDGRPIGAYGDFGGSIAGEIALGARVLPALRLELALSHRPNFEFRGNANFLNAGKDQPLHTDVTQTSAMVNGYLDLVPLFDWDLGRFEPFVGAGLGVSRNYIAREHYEFPDLQQWTETRSGTHWSLAWSATVGSALRVGPQSLIELSYRYSDFGRVMTKDGPITVERGGNKFKVDNVGGTQGRLRSHGLYLGFRQEF